MDCFGLRCNCGPDCEHGIKQVKQPSSNSSIQYYDKNAEDFIKSTENADMQLAYEEFLPHVGIGGLILDVGCGSGRDIAHFQKTNLVIGIEPSKRLASHARNKTGALIIEEKIQDYTPDYKFDGVWCCASLLHVPPEDITKTLEKISYVLKKNGTLYVSFKYGLGEREKNGRTFTDMDEMELVANAAGTGLRMFKTWVTQDVRSGREDEYWLNAILKKA